MPRAPGGAQPAASTSPEEAQAKGRRFLLVVFLVALLGGAGAYWYFSTHTEVDRAQVVRDSLRALGAGPPRIDTTLFTDPDDLTPVRRARALRVALDGILRANRATLLGFREGPIDTAAADRAEKRRAQQYALFARRWHDRIDAATRGGADFRYAPGIRTGPQMESVTNYLGAALSVMRDMVPRDQVKPRTERQTDAVSVVGYLNSAATVLTNLPR